MRFASLGSGSRGNATVVSAGATTILIDCGFSARMIRRRMQALDLSPDHIDAILITHEHGDHVRGAGALARQAAIPLWMTHGTQVGSSRTLGQVPVINTITAGTPVVIGALEITPVNVPHDTREPVQFVISDGTLSLGVLTDTGHVTDVIRAAYQPCHAMLLEFNHDTALLANGPYPRALKDRISGTHGHLANHQASSLAMELVQGNLRHVACAHLSAENNSPALVREHLSQLLNGVASASFAIASQDSGLRWQEL